MPNKNIEVYYGSEVPKPPIPPGIDYESRRVAHERLLAYHGDRRFPPENGDYYFRGLTEFLRNHPPDPKFTEQDLLNYVKSHRVISEPYDIHSLSHLQQLERSIRGSRTLSSTCPYRNIEAATIGRFSFRGTYRNIGGVGTNGGHEYTRIDPSAQVGMVANMMIECLVVAGIPEHSLEMIKTIAAEAIQNRLHQPYVDSPSCMDLSILTVACIQEYAKRANVPITPQADFASCLMNRMNRPAYEKLNTEPPPQLGRKDCISACAEQNALMKQREAANVACHVPLTEEDAVYVVGQERSGFISNTQDGTIPATRYHYYISRGANQILELRTVMIDDRLLWHPVSGKNRNTLRWTGDKFDPEMTNLFFRQRDSFYVLNDGTVHVFLGTQHEQRHPEIGVRTLGMTPLANFPLAETHHIRHFHVSPTSLHTSALPCLYCTRAIIENDVGTTYIDGKLEGLKGDDGLALEYLMRLNKGEVRFV